MPHARAGVEIRSVNDGPILICYDGSIGAEHAIAAAAGLLGPRRAVVLDLGPVQEEAALGSEVLAFDEMERELTTAQAESGAELARNAGFHARRCADIDAPAWLGVVEVADEIGADAIVVGSRGLCGVKALL